MTDQQVVAVVGAGPGVGFEVARAFGRRGYKVGLVARTANKLADMVDSLRAAGIDADGFRGDADDETSLTTALELLSETLGPVDVLQYGVPGPLARGFLPAADISPALMREFIDVRLLGAVAATRAVLGSMRARGSGALLFTSGTSGETPHPNTAAMGAPNAALRMYAQHLHTELKQDGIFVAYVPIALPPIISDPAIEAARGDIPDQVKATVAENPIKITAIQVGEILYRLATTGKKFETTIPDPVLPMA
ncbi:SDR family NAD(P)-dependent oxidoreductase [Nocardia transvalensis]|uniref:SDR family NAD(P)-dependent oxidoreductase n=1 Tax=Nocardia transvalensis TaxID=37333 RepID=UPI001894213A|nr:SDR family NAD(P)-dependent oxidoreductase [Nocardia transvalensis]MBF6331081.1 SDR family NAD(P)-dependent oxidoreductase [Nocardia transvalensis]